MLFCHRPEPTLLATAASNEVVAVVGGKFLKTDEVSAVVGSSF
jgi:hypothetical protein